MPIEKTEEQVKEFLTLNIANDNLFYIFVPHPVYSIRGYGRIHYLGNDKWRIDEIEFPTSGVKDFSRDTRKIYLR
jgi:hypothetical protein